MASHFERGRAWIVIAVPGVAALAAASLVGVRGGAEPPLAAAEPPLAVAEPPLAYDVAPLPAGLDSLTSLEDAARRIEECADDCSGIVYFWSQRMPLSRSGIAEISGAARSLGFGSRWSAPKKCTNTPTPIRASEPV